MATITSTGNGHLTNGYTNGHHEEKEECVVEEEAQQVVVATDIITTLKQSQQVTNEVLTPTTVCENEVHVETENSETVVVVVATPEATVEAVAETTETTEAVPATETTTTTTAPVETPAAVESEVKTEQPEPVAAKNEKQSKKEKAKKEKKNKKEKAATEKNGEVQTTDVSVVVDNSATTNDTIKSVKRKESVGAKIKRVFTLGKGDKKKSIEQVATTNGTTAVVEPTGNGDVTATIEKVHENGEAKLETPVATEVTEKTNGEIISETKPTTENVVEVTATEETAKVQELTLTATGTTEATAAAATTTTEKQGKHHCIIV